MQYGDPMKQLPPRKYTLRTETIRVLSSQGLRRVNGGWTGVTVCPTAMCQEDGTSSTLDGHCYQTGNC